MREREGTEPASMPATEAERRRTSWQRISDCSRSAHEYCGLRFPFPTRTSMWVVMGLLLLSAGCGRFLTRPRKHRHFSLNPIAQPILLYIQVVSSLHVEPEAVSGSEVPG